MNSPRVYLGPFLVGIAAFLWASDSVLRYSAIEKIDSTWIVFFEHSLVVFLLLPWIVLKHKRTCLNLSFKEWLSAIFTGVGGSAIATVFFTASFHYINPSVAVLIQKLQPVFVVFIAALVLNEKPKKSFYFWGAIVLAATLVLSFPTLSFRFLLSKKNLDLKGLQYALIAAFLWASATISGKVLLRRTAPVVAVFWRFFFGLIALAALLGFAKQPLSWSWINSAPLWWSLLYISLIPGFLAMTIYYCGLSKTPASIATFVELIYPIGAVALNTFFLHTPLEMTQLIAGAILLFSVMMISI